jgi:hypothetical protein
LGFMGRGHKSEVNSAPFMFMGQVLGRRLKAHEVGPYHQPSSFCDWYKNRS